VIATSSSGRRFAALARYLLFGRSGDEPERVAWAAGRNLGTDDPEVAAALMQATPVSPSAGGPGGLGLRTIAQLEPFQCSIKVYSRGPP